MDDADIVWTPPFLNGGGGGGGGGKKYEKMKRDKKGGCLQKWGGVKPAHYVK